MPSPEINTTAKDGKMSKTPDMTAMFKDVMGSFPVDTAAMEDAFKTSATLNEKLSSVALTAVEKSTEISSKWTKDTVAKMTEMAKVKSEPADYAKAMSDFASSSAEAAAEHMAAFAEIAKKVQMDTVELMMAAGKDMQEDATAVVKKASSDVQAAAKKASAK
tara:strand:+ start:237 stop:722 length:486 start_codon:yes stop_codon:yes gene_type:complete